MSLGHPPVFVHLSQLSRPLTIAEADGSLARELGMRPLRQRHVPTANRLIAATRYQAGRRSTPRCTQQAENVCVNTLY